MKKVYCRPEEPKVCKMCGKEKDASEFYWRSVVRKNITHYVKAARCKPCFNREKTLWILSDRARAIHNYSKDADRKFHRIYDLNVDLIRKLISGPCDYCGETKVLMTLDRIDNALGHTINNVIPACIRCNTTRRNMPWKAWLLVAKSMRQAREEGLFHDWIGVTGTKQAYPIR